MRLCVCSLRRVFEPLLLGLELTWERCGESWRFKRGLIRIEVPDSAAYAALSLMVTYPATRTAFPIPACPRSWARGGGERYVLIPAVP